MQKSERFRAELSLLFIALCWAANYSVIQFILQSFPVKVFVTMRFAVIALAGWAALAALHKPWQWRREDFPRLILIGIIGGGAYQYLFVLGLSQTTSFSSALLNTTAPLLSLLILAIFGIEKIHSRQWAGYAVAFAGVALFLIESSKGSGTNFKGDLISLGGALCWAVYGILAKPLSHKYPAVTVGTWTYSFCFLAIACYGAGPTLRYDFTPTRPLVWVAVILSGVVCVTVGWMIWVHGIRLLGVSGTVKYAFAVPISAGFIAWIFQDEKFPAAKIAGALGVLAGILIARVPGWRTPPVEPARAAHTLR